MAKNCKSCICSNSASKITLQVERENVIATWLSAAILANKKFGNKLTVDLFACAAFLWERVENRKAEKNTSFQWNGPMLGQILQLAVRAQEYTAAVKILKKLKETYGQPPEFESLQEFVNDAVSRNNALHAIVCVEFAIDAGFPEAAKLASEVKSSLQLTDEQQAHLGSLLGQRST